MLRYPGGKRKVSKKIVDLILETYADSYSLTSYCEPFFGSGAVCLRLLQTVGSKIQRVIINDLDPGIYAIWWSVVNAHEEFKELIHAFKPSRNAFTQFKQELTEGKELPLAELALRKLAVHRMSYSGLGTMAGGPMSAIASRWSPCRIDRDIDEARQLLNGKHVTLTKMDYATLLAEIDGETLVYLDPPYLQKGAVLYQYSFRQQNHKELRELLQNAKFPWVLSYDDHPEILRMYAHDVIHKLPNTYSINGVTKRNELLITPNR